MKAIVWIYVAGACLSLVYHLWFLSHEHKEREIARLPGRNPAGALVQTVILVACWPIMLVAFIVHKARRASGDRPYSEALLCAATRAGFQEPGGSCAAVREEQATIKAAYDKLMEVLDRSCFRHTHDTRDEEARFVTGAAAAVAATKTKDVRRLQLLTAQTVLQWIDTNPTDGTIDVAVHAFHHIVEVEDDPDAGVERAGADWARTIGLA